jgi:tyrosyl-tRNA synthetase
MKNPSVRMGVSIGQHSSLPRNKVFTMDITQKSDLISRNTLEVITKEEVEGLLQCNSSPKGYIGVEPSGLFHLGWMIWANKFNDLIDAGVNMTLLEATWHAWINDKFGGDMEKIQLCASYIEHCLSALGTDMSRVKLVKADQLVSDRMYWANLLKVAKSLSLSRIKRAVTIMGRREDDTLVDFSKLIYPCMQVEDIFYLDLDFCLGGMDQRRAHVLAREVADAYKFKKPIAIHTPLLSALQGSGRMDVHNAEADQAMAECKMSKSKPESCIFIHDSPESIKAKMNLAYCPPKEVEGNPVLDIARYILLPSGPFVINRPAKYGGDISFATSDELVRSYQGGNIHPLDLKLAVSEGLGSRLAPVRNYFMNVGEAREALTALTSTG